MTSEKIKDTLRKLNIKVVIVVYILLYTVSPLVNQATSIYLTTYFYMAIVVVTVAFTFVVCALKDVREYVLLILPFIIFETLQLFVVSSNVSPLLQGYRMLLFMLPLCLGYCIMKYGKAIRLYSLCIFIVFGVTLATTIVGCINNPNAARILATTATSQDATAVSFNWQNIGGFTFTYSCTLLYPLVIVAYKQRRIPLWVALLLAAAEIALAINTEYTLSLMLMLFTSLLFVFPRNLTTKKFIIFSVIGFVAVVVFSSFMENLMYEIGTAIGNSNMTEKMTAVFGGQEALDNMEDRRVDRYLLSIEMFIKHPFFGTWVTEKKTVGGHSFILDTLARFGIPGGIILFFMYRGIFKVFYKPLSDRYGFGFVFWAFLAPIVLSCINTGMWLDNLCLFSPIFLTLIYSPPSRRLRRRSSSEDLEPVPLTAPATQGGSS